MTGVQMGGAYPGSDPDGTNPLPYVLSRAFGDGGSHTAKFGGVRTYYIQGEYAKYPNHDCRHNT